MFLCHHSCVIIIHMIAVSCSSGHFIQFCYIKDFASYIVYCEVWMYMIVGIQLVCIVGSECILLWGYSLCVLWGVNVYYCGDIACVCFLQMAAQYSTRLYTPIHTSPKTIIVGISKKIYQTFLQRLISDMHMIIQYPQNTIPRIPKRPTTPVTHPYISPVYMHCVFTQTRTEQLSL